MYSFEEAKNEDRTELYKCDGETGWNLGQPSRPSSAGDSWRKIDSP